MKALEPQVRFSQRTTCLFDYLQSIPKKNAVSGPKAKKLVNSRTLNLKVTDSEDSEDSDPVDLADLFQRKRKLTAKDTNRNPVDPQTGDSERPSKRLCS